MEPQELPHLCGERKTLTLVLCLNELSFIYKRKCATACETDTQEAPPLVCPVPEELREPDATLCSRRGLWVRTENLRPALQHLEDLAPGGSGSVLIPLGSLCQGLCHTFPSDL